MKTFSLDSLDFQTDNGKFWQRWHIGGGGSQMFDMWFNDLSQLEKKKLFCDTFHLFCTRMREDTRGRERNATNKSIVSIG